MSDETQEEGCGEAMRKGRSVEDLYCGGPLVIELSGADAAVSTMIEVLEAARQQIYEAMAIPSHLLGAGPRLTDAQLGLAEAFRIAALREQLDDELYAEMCRPDFLAITRGIARS